MQSSPFFGWQTRSIKIYSKDLSSLHVFFLKKKLKPILLYSTVIYLMSLARSHGLRNQNNKDECDTCICVSRGTSLEVFPQTMEISSPISPLHIIYPVAREAKLDQ